MYQIDVISNSQGYKNDNLRPTGFFRKYTIKELTPFYMAVIEEEIKQGNLVQIWEIQSSEALKPLNKNDYDYEDGA